MNMIETLEGKADRLATRKIPSSARRPVRVNVNQEGERERVRAYEGICIARGGASTGFTVRKISFGEGVEWLFQ